MTETDDESVWPAVLRLLDDAQTDVRVVSPDPELCRAALRELQLTERSTTGAIAARTGGVIVDSGWLRVLGAGSAGLPGLAQSAAGEPGGPHLVIALDAIGGRFAVDGGGLGVGPGEVCYWGPDTLAWSGIGGGYSAFIAWALGGGLTDFYGSLRWKGWQDDTRPLRPDEGWALYPPPFAEQGQDTNAVSRAVVPLAELHEFYAEAARRFDGNAPTS